MSQFRTVISSHLNLILTKCKKNNATSVGEKTDPSIKSEFRSVIALIASVTVTIADNIRSGSKEFKVVIRQEHILVLGFRTTLMKGFDPLQMLISLDIHKLIYISPLK